MKSGEIAESQFGRNEDFRVAEGGAAAPYSYLNALERIFVVENVGAWTPSLRSKDAIRSSETRYFVDPSIATAALGATPSDLMRDLRTFGFLFETLISAPKLPLTPNLLPLTPKIWRFSDFVVYFSQTAGKGELSPLMTI